MQTTHTPGPWKVTRDEYTPCSIEAENGDGMALAKVYLTDPKTRKRTPEFAANARLIAAAPTMKASLKRLADASAAVGNMAHAGRIVTDEAWSELYAANCEASGILANLGTTPMSATHTPGPWYFRPEEPSVEAQNPSGFNVLIACVGSLSSRDEMKSNARLIAASPEMLAALKYAAELIPIARQHFPKSIKNSDTFRLENTCATINKAIHQATGDS